jgi:hypothetical protein
MKYILCGISLLLLSGYEVNKVLRGAFEADPLFTQQSHLVKVKDKKYIVDFEVLQKSINDATDNIMRNALLEELITISDRSCASHQSVILANSNTWNVGTGALSSLFSAIGTVAEGESVKAGLAAGAALTNSTRSLVNEEVYAKALGTTIVRATMSAREKQLAAISNGMGEPLSKYSVKKGVRDIYNYHNRCSFEGLGCT